MLKQGNCVARGLPSDTRIAKRPSPGSHHNQGRCDSAGCGTPSRPQTGPNSEQGCANSSQPRGFPNNRAAGPGGRRPSPSGLSSHAGQYVIRQQAGRTHAETAGQPQKENPYQETPQKAAPKARKPRGQNHQQPPHRRN
ncbi:hypothetical protein QE152_g38185 [Popillia japonica]|uniref:Uncharacterized protein n=1 Tax=Popillia japonica TaxID=7064 RepID=A0AAW1I810_POPJA